MRNIIVIGGSAGALEPVCTLLKQLPANLPAAIFVVIHMAESSNLGEVLKRCGRLNVLVPANGERIRPGHVYLAPPAHHLALNDSQVEITKGPRENRHRPSVDVLFRSAARAHRDKVIAVILSGALDDGAAGAHAVKVRGGTVVVQDPSDAKVPDMPKNTLRYVQADHCAPIAQMPALLSKLVRAKTVARGVKKGTGRGNNGEPKGKRVAFVCPECSGPLTEIHKGHLAEFRCQVGHAFSPQSLSKAHADALERALWVAMRTLNERRAIQETLSRQYLHDPAICRRFEENAEAAAHDIALLREIIERI
jgi:two-component system, chemotaxis family, protein-glutamate methylesterase/glutaminase